MLLPRSPHLTKTFAFHSQHREICSSEHIRFTTTTLYYTHWKRASPSLVFCPLRPATVSAPATKHPSKLCPLLRTGRADEKRLGGGETTGKGHLVAQPPDAMFQPSQRRGS
ncbi:hypothetical protein Salat_1395100 [Sesamum alatum]|uniref:Uncharacterized protein n=1 Tax=Sesamum alatum TaxID=300844 RepID=A0AAE1Y9K6_9LAMI|nr:hypothetical protein Salat_1395100 [Sesamum alatum]